MQIGGRSEKSIGYMDSLFQLPYLLISKLFNFLKIRGKSSIICSIRLTIGHRDNPVIKVLVNHFSFFYLNCGKTLRHNGRSAASIHKNHISGRVLNYTSIRMVIMSAKDNVNTLDTLRYGKRSILQIIISAGPDTGMKSKYHNMWILFFHYLIHNLLSNISNRHK